MNSSTPANFNQQGKRTDNTRGSARGRGAKRGTSNSGKSKASTGGLRQKAEFNGIPCCFDYNNDKCTRASAGTNSCKDANNKLYSHMCNKLDKVSGKYCLLEHQRCKNH